MQRHPGNGTAVAIEHESGVNAALCGDVSRHGLRLSLDRPLAVGETVSVKFGPDLVLKGQVAWVEAADCGIRFDEVVGSPAANAGNLPTLDRRAARTPALRNPDSRFREGLGVTVVLPGCERKAVIRWTDDHFASFTLAP